MALLDSSGKPIAVGPQEVRIPTLPEMKKFLDLVTGATIAFLAQRQADPYTIRSVGQIISRMTLNGKQTPIEVEQIISTVASEQLEKLKLELLNASVTTASLPTPKASA
jgi:hypothetical protein